MKVCCAVLASGESKRYGKDKLKERINGRTFLERVVEVAKGFGEVFVISKEMVQLDVDVVLNKFYKEGISRSVSLALEEAQRRFCDYLLIFLGDMPFIKEECAKKVLEAADKTDKLILYPYSERFGKGFPTLIKKEAFHFKKALRGDKGFKQIIYTHPEIVEKVYIEETGCFKDIDRPDDLKSL